jgi:hypothetical protein
MAAELVDLWLGEEDAERLHALGAVLGMEPGEVVLRTIRMIDPALLAKGSPLRTCANCGTPYTQEREVKRGEYCPPCRKRLGSVERQRAYRERKAVRES